MTDLVKELNHRRKKARNRLSEQFFNGLYDYIDLTVQHPLLQEILKQLQADPNSFHSMWPEYNKLYTEVYLFIKENPYEVVKKKYKQFYKIDDDDFDTFFGTMSLLVSPFTIWALIKRIRYCYNLDRVHDGLVTAIKTRSILSVPTYSGNPDRVLPIPERAVTTPASLAVTQTTINKHPEAYRTLGLTNKSQWYDITIQFTSIFDVKITYNHGVPLKADYIAMGFADNRSKQEEGKRKMSWDTLAEMSVNKGIISIGNEDSEKYKKHKQEICSLFKAYFGLNADPFEQFNKQTHSYKSKFTILPDDGEIRVGMYQPIDERYQTATGKSNNEFSS